MRLYQCICLYLLHQYVSCMNLQMTIQHILMRFGAKNQTYRHDIVTDWVSMETIRENTRPPENKKKRKKKMEQTSAKRKKKKKRGRQ